MLQPDFYFRIHLTDICYSDLAGGSHCLCVSVVFFVGVGRVVVQIYFPCMKKCVHRRKCTKWRKGETSVSTSLFEWEVKSGGKYFGHNGVCGTRIVLSSGFTMAQNDEMLKTIQLYMLWFQTHHVTFWLLTAFSRNLLPKYTSRQETGCPGKLIQVIQQKCLL